MPIYDYSCEACGWTDERLVASAGDRPTSIHCLGCGGSAKFVLSPTRTDFKFTDKEVRIPSNPTSVWMGGKRNG